MTESAADRRERILLEAFAPPPCAWPAVPDNSPNALLLRIIKLIANVALEAEAQSRARGPQEPAS